MISLLLVACGGDADTAATSSTATAETTSTTTTTIAATEANALTDFDRTEIVLGGEVWTVAVADTPELRSLGLMHVTELVDVDGMIFVWDEEISAAFWMKDTRMSIDIAFFDAEGGLVPACEPEPWRQNCHDLVTMVPCVEEPCPSYPSLDPFQYAIETEVGGFEGIELVLDVEALGDGQ